jgi:hypothetical protein
MINAPGGYVDDAAAEDQASVPGVTGKRDERTRPATYVLPLESTAIASALSAELVVALTPPMTEAYFMTGPVVEDWALPACEVAWSPTLRPDRPARTGAGANPKINPRLVASHNERPAGWQGERENPSRRTAI